MVACWADVPGAVFPLEAGNGAGGTRPDPEMTARLPAAGQAGLPKQAFLAGDRIGSRPDLNPERAARQSLHMTSAGLGHGGTIARSGLFGPQLRPVHDFERISLIFLV